MLGRFALSRGCIRALLHEATTLPAAGLSASSIYCSQYQIHLGDAACTAGTRPFLQPPRWAAPSPCTTSRCARGVRMSRSERRAAAPRCTNHPPPPPLPAQAAAAAREPSASSSRKTSPPPKQAPAPAFGDEFYEKALAAVYANKALPPGGPPSAELEGRRIQVGRLNRECGCWPPLAAVSNTT